MTFLHEHRKRQQLYTAKLEILANRGATTHEAERRTPSTQPHKGEKKKTWPLPRSNEKPREAPLPPNALAFTKKSNRKRADDAKEASRRRTPAPRLGSLTKRAKRRERRQGKDTAG